MKKMFLLFAVAAFVVSCKKEEENKSGVFKGPETSVYHGKAWSSVKLNRQGVPEQITMTLNDEVLNSVQLGETSPTHDHSNDIQVPLHPKAAEATPFKFFMLNWNPAGHPPADIYDKPHFDIHLYMTSSADVMNYTDEVKLNADPAPEYLPAHHIGLEPVPMMGKHWIDVTSPELNGLPFTQTFIYGTYDSKVTFYEPMITLDFLKTTTQFERSIPQPAKFQKSGYYPTKFRIMKHDGVTEIIFDDLVYRQSS